MQNYDGLKMKIVESGSGKTVFENHLDSPVGVVYWSNQNPLPEGHYIVILQQNDKYLCDAKMEVIKQ